MPNSKYEAPQFHCERYSGEVTHYYAPEDEKCLQCDRQDLRKRMEAERTEEEGINSDG